MDATGPHAVFQRVNGGRIQLTFRSINAMLDYGSSLLRTGLFFPCNALQKYDQSLGTRQDGTVFQRHHEVITFSPPM